MDHALEGCEQMEPTACRIQITDYDPRWPEFFRDERDRIRAVLGPYALEIDHVGSTAVPGLPAKPILDIVLTVQDSTDEDTYMSALQTIGYALRHREPTWHEHRMLRKSRPEINLHVFSYRCTEIDRMRLLRDWLRRNACDRELYARTKLALAQQEWKDVQDYADAKTSVITEIIERAQLGSDQ